MEATKMEATKKDGRDAELEASKKSAREALDKLLEAKDHFRQAAESAGLDVREEAIEQLARGRAKVDEFSDEASQYMVDKPLQTLGIAFLGGFILSHFLKK